MFDELIKLKEKVEKLNNQLDEKSKEVAYLREIIEVDSDILAKKLKADERIYGKPFEPQALKKRIYKGKESCSSEVGAITKILKDEGQPLHITEIARRLNYKGILGPLRARLNKYVSSDKHFTRYGAGVYYLLEEE